MACEECIVVAARRSRSANCKVNIWLHRDTRLRARSRRDLTRTVDVGARDSADGTAPSADPPEISL